MEDELREMQDANAANRRTLEWRTKARRDTSAAGRGVLGGATASPGVSLTHLTRFNKICHPSQRPRRQVDKEAIGLSRVQQCSSTYNDDDNNKEYSIQMLHTRCICFQEIPILSRYF